MINYKPPKYDKLLFEFTKSGYKPPNFNNVSFFWDPKRKDLKQAIYGQEFKADYLKSCDTTIIGYGTEEVQIIRTNCIYGGIRDVSAYIKVYEYRDLPAYIKSTKQTRVDFSLLLRPWYIDIIADVASTIKGFNREFITDLNTVVKGIGSSSLDIINLIKSVHSGVKEELHSSIKGVTTGSTDIYTYLKQTNMGITDLIFFIDLLYRQEININCLIKGQVIDDLLDLRSIIKSIGSTTVDIPAYIKRVDLDNIDLSSYIKSTVGSYKDIFYSLYGWQEVDLFNAIRSMQLSDLFVSLIPNYLKDLQNFINPVAPFDINVALHGWANVDLPVQITYYTPDWDLKTTLTCIEPADLKCMLYVKKGIEIVVDLPVVLTNLNISDLYSSMNIIECKDLSVFIESFRNYIDLNGTIFPKLVYVRHNINIPFLECRDLAAVINFFCAHSGFSDLNVVLDVQSSADLRVAIYGGDDSNIIDLPCIINYYGYIVQNKIDLLYMNTGPGIVSTTLSYANNSPIYFTDTLSISVPYGYCRIKEGYSDINSYIRGEYMSSDLMCSINPYMNPHVDTSNVAPSFIALSLKNNKEEFRKYVSLVLNSYANTYYYFSGNQKAYRAFEEDHWVVRLEGYELVPKGSGFERKHVNRKYIFNLKNYNSIDAAIIDAIDRVTSLRSSDLEVYLNPVGDAEIEYNTNTMLDLQVSIIGSRRYKSNRKLYSKLKCVVQSEKDIVCSITSVLYSGEDDVEVFITGVEMVEEYYDGIVDFNFIGGGQSKMTPSQLLFKFS